jgi:hypothetical protein
MKKKVILRYNTHQKFIMTHNIDSSSDDNSNSGTGSGSGICTGSEAGIGSGTVFFRFFLDTLIRSKRPAVCRHVLTGICLKRFIKLIIIDTRTHSNI